MLSLGADRLEYTDIGHKRSPAGRLWILDGDEMRIRTKAAGPNILHLGEWQELQERGDCGHGRIDADKKLVSYCPNADWSPWKIEAVREKLHRRFRGYQVVTFHADGTKELTT